MIFSLKQVAHIKEIKKSPIHLKEELRSLLRALLGVFQCPFNERSERDGCTNHLCNQLPVDVYLIRWKEHAVMTFSVS